MKRFGVIGHPVAHSLSPLMHNTAYSLLGLECTYDSFDIAPESLSEALRDFATKGFCGLNVTIPHKESVSLQVQELSDEARAVGAVNTILFESGRLRGDNTDVYGVAASLEPYRTSLDKERILVLGAGGTSRAITYALLTRFSPSEIVIANRNLSRANELVRHFQPHAKGITLKASPADQTTLSHLATDARLIINSTSIGMSPAIHASPIGDWAHFHSKQIVFDLIYTPFETKLLALARRSGARTISGLEMFLHQGAQSFELWLGKKMPVEQIRPVIENELKNRRQYHIA
ncbi:MAG: shikimate dehydrogenase [Ignavibacteriales bacterium]|nr:shikimate dehydrogenase [Ignavibacteriales bacterium]